MATINCTSLPRSGYHYLANQLARASITLTKSHDFGLDSDPPSSKIPHVILIRHPFQFLTSWLELTQIGYNKDCLNRNNIFCKEILKSPTPESVSTVWEIIDAEGKTLPLDITEPWINHKVEYATKFADKWLPACQPLPSDTLKTSTYILDYSEIPNHIQILSTRNKNLDWSTFFPTITPFTPRPDTAILERSSKRITHYLHQVEDRLLQASAAIVNHWSKYPQCPS
jgi:hypothetical protein